MPKRFTLIIVATLVLLLLLVIFKPYTVTYDKELSKVEGVSLKRIHSDGHSSSHSSGGNNLDYTGGTLQDILAVLTNDSYPIIELTDLPKGHYSINAKVDSKDKDLSKKVYKGQTAKKQEGNSTGRRNHSTDKTLDIGDGKVKDKRRHPLHGTVRWDDMEADERNQETGRADDSGTTRSADDRRREDSRRGETGPNEQVLQKGP
jgi:hypothetical protein